VVGVKRAAVVLCAACACAILLASCAGGGKASDDGPVTVGYGFGFDAGDTGDRVAFAHMASHGGPKVKTREMGSPQNAVTGLLRGDIQFANLSQSSVINAVGQGADIRVVLTANSVPEWEMVSAPGIASAAQLRGKRVGTFGETDDTAALSEIVLREAGLGFGDVKRVALMDSQKRAVALARGRLDATPLEFVDREHLKKELPGFHVLGSLANRSPVRSQTVFAVSGRYLREHPGRVRRVVDGLLAGYATLYAPGGERAFVAQAERGALHGEPRALARGAFRRYRSLSFWPRPGRAPTRAQYDRNVAFWKRYDIVQKSSPFERVWDTSFWR
jgi:ABC-type nitrate/sulfonate/bicarbonate transport system substrate-binding protein